MNDLLPGRIQLMFVIPAVPVPHIKAERLRAYGIATGKRSTLAPDVPTLAGAGPRRQSSPSVQRTPSLNIETLFRLRHQPRRWR